MQIRPIISALSRHKAGTILIALQIALTLAIVCNALYLIKQRAAKLSAPLGIDTRDLFVVRNEWVARSQDYQASSRADINALRELPQVAGAFATDSEPLGGSGWDSGIFMSPDQRRESSHAAQYFFDEQAMSVLGVQLIAGRNFRADEVRSMELQDSAEPPVAIITQALARQIFPDGHVLGKTIFFAPDTKPTTVIGVVEHLHIPYTTASSDSFSDQSVLMPLHLINSRTDYIVRARPGQLEAAMSAARKTLFDLNGARVIDARGGILSFDQLRAGAFARDRGMMELMGSICAVLLAVTAAGIVGLTTFWVGQRRRQIGVRRALGATKRDILTYFMTENFLIAVAGVLLGTLLAVGLNLWMVANYAQDHLPWGFVGIGAIAVLLLGQAAVLAPALRASRVPPVVATRSA